MKSFPSWPAVFSGTLLSLAICLSGSFLIALWIGFSSDANYDITWILRGIGVAALFAGGLVSGRKAGSNGWVHGCISGLVYFAALFVVMVFLFSLNLIWRDVLMGAFLSAALGSIGGICGINLPVRRRQRLPMAG